MLENITLYTVTEQPMETEAPEPAETAIDQLEDFHDAESRVFPTEGLMTSILKVLLQVQGGERP